MWYRFDLLRFAWQLLPPLLRSQLLLAFLKAMYAPLFWIYDRFVALRSQSDVRLLSNGQVIALVDALTRYYNTYEGDIYITDGESNLCYLYLREEMQSPLYLTPNQGEAPFLTHSYEGRYSPDFYICLPDFLREQEAETIEIINRYKPAGRRFDLHYYTYG